MKEKEKCRGDSHLPQMTNWVLCDANWASRYFSVIVEYPTITYLVNLPAIVQNRTPQKLALSIPNEIEMAVPKIGINEKVAIHEPFFST